MAARPSLVPTESAVPDRSYSAVPVLVVLVGLLMAVVAVVLTALVFSRRHQAE